MPAFLDKSIRFKFSAALVAVVTLVLVIFSSTIVLHNIRIIQTQLAQQMKEASHLSKLSLSTALWNFNHSYVSDFVESLFLYEDIVFINVFSGNDVIKKKMRTNISNMTFIDFNASPEYMSQETIIKHIEQPIGKIQIVPTRERVRETIYSNIRDTILLLFLIVSAILLTNLLITRRILFNPLKKLESSAIKISQGDLDTPIDISGKDEIGQLAVILDHMIKNIKEITASRDELNNEIDMRIRSEEALRISEERLRTAGKVSYDLIYEWEVASDKLKWFGNIDGFLGYDVREISRDIRGWLDLIHPEDRRKLDSAVEKHKTSTEPIKYEYRVRHKDGKYRYWEDNALPLLDENGFPYRWIGVCTDITERKQAEDHIKASLKEKEVLLSEIHHRVKNNMQVTSSLLNLQSKRIRDKKTVEIFKESEGRLKTMALVHDKLYRSENIANINFKEYIDDLLKNQLASYGVNTNNISVNIEIEDIFLEIDLATPCGLIINELVSNSLKYAFPHGKKGEIKIVLRAVNETEFELIVGDNGIGIHEDIDFENTDTFGLYLVNLLTKGQLEGKMELLREQGTEYCIRFKRPTYSM